MTPEAAHARGWHLVETDDYESWRVARHGLLTASDVAAVMGLSPYRSRNAVLKAKRGPVPGDISTPAMRGGSHLEAGVFAWFLEDLRRTAAAKGAPPPEGATCRMPGGQSMLVGHPNHHLRLAASPDAFVGLPGGRLVEVKVTSPKPWGEHWGLGAIRTPRAWRNYSDTSPPSIGKCPLSHWVQLQVQLACTREDGGWVVGNCGTQRLDFEFERDPVFGAHIERAAADFAAEAWG